MVQFEYKVVGINGFDNDVPSGHVKDGAVEAVINKYATDGWEYQNAMILPSVECRDYIYYTGIKLIFRRAKS